MPLGTGIFFVEKLIFSVIVYKECNETLFLGYEIELILFSK